MEDAFFSMLDDDPDPTPLDDTNTGMLATPFIDKEGRGGGGGRSQGG